MYRIKELKKKYGIKDAQLAEWFGYKDANTYRNTKKRKILEEGIIKLLNHIAEASKDQDVSDKTLPDRG